jgi:hypothetical protein
MSTFTVGERVRVVFSPARGAPFTGGPDVPPRGSVRPSPSDAEIVMVLPTQRQGQGQPYERQYLVRFDNGQQSLVWEDELQPITPHHATQQTAEEDTRG